MPIGTLATIASLIGSGVGLASKIAKSKEEEDYLEKTERAQKAEEARREKQQRMQAIANYLGVGKEASLVPQRNVSMPGRPNLSGYDIASGLGSLASQYGSQLGSYGSSFGGSSVGSSSRVRALNDASGGGFA